MFQSKVKLVPKNVQYSIHIFYSPLIITVVTSYPIRERKRPTQPLAKFSLLKNSYKMEHSRVSVDSFFFHHHKIRHTEKGGKIIISNFQIEIQAFLMFLTEIEALFLSPNEIQAFFNHICG